MYVLMLLSLIRNYGQKFADIAGQSEAGETEACQPHLEMEYDPIILLGVRYLLTGLLPNYPVQSNHQHFLLHFISLPST